MKDVQSEYDELRCATCVPEGDSLLSHLREITGGKQLEVMLQRALFKDYNVPSATVDEQAMHVRCSPSWYRRSSYTAPKMMLS